MLEFQEDLEKMDQFLTIIGTESPNRTLLMFLAGVLLMAGDKLFPKPWINVMKAGLNTDLPQASPGVTLTLADQMGNRIRKWLSNPALDSNRLIGWLEGLNLPAFDFNDDPYVCVLDGIETLNESDRAQFVEGVARLLDKVTEPSFLTTKKREEILYNLFKLSARMKSDSAHLNDALHAINQRSKIGAGWKDLSYRGLELREPLRVALIDSEFACFDKILMADHPNTPNFKALGISVNKMVELLGDEEKSYQARFSEQIEKIYAMHPEKAVEFDRFLIQEAMNQKWSDWAISSLPRRWVALADDSTIVIWKKIWEELPRKIKDGTSRLKNNLVVIKKESLDFKIANEFGYQFDLLVQSNPFESRRSIVGISQSILNSMLLVCKNNDKQVVNTIEHIYQSLRESLRSCNGKSTSATFFRRKPVFQEEAAKAG